MYGLPRDIALATAVSIKRKDLGLRLDKLAHTAPFIDESRLPKAKERPPMLPGVERGDSPQFKRIARYLRKIGII